MPNPGVLTTKLGKAAPRLDRRTFKLAKYLPAIIPPPPPEVSWVTKVPKFPMYLNDELGDCVAAAAGHMINQWTYYATGAEQMPSDGAILKAYEDVGGYIPGDPATDNGTSMLDMLNYWRQTGVAGHKILAFVTVDPTRHDEIFSAIQLFGSLYTGIQLPISAQGEAAWTVPNGGAFGDGSPGSWGGHAIPIMGASPKSYTCITWGQRLKMSHTFFSDYVDECYAVLSIDWLNKTGISPSLLNLDQLKEDLAQL